MGEREMSMVERVARAIWNIRREDEDRCDMELEDMGREHSVWAEARAAIKAMREPDKAMTDVLGDVFGHCGLATQEYQNAIDAALSETPSPSNPSAYQEP